MSGDKTPFWKNPQILTSIASAFMIMAALLVVYGKFAGNNEEVVSEDKDNWAEAVERESKVPESKIKYNEMDQPPVVAHSAKSTEVVSEEIDIEALSEEEFEKFAQDALKIMPRKSDLQNLKPQEVHHFPEPVQKAGHKLAQIKDILTKRPDLEEVGIRFYEECANDNEAMTSVRALCLSNLAQYKAMKGEVIDFSKYPERVLELANETLKP